MTVNYLNYFIHYQYNLSKKSYLFKIFKSNIRILEKE